MLRSSGVIIIVSDGWDRGEPDLLASCYRRAIALADEHQLSSIAFPAISTGVYGYPREPAAELAIATLRSNATSDRRVVLVAFDLETLAIYQRLLSR